MDTNMNITSLTEIRKVDYRKLTTCKRCEIWPNTLDDRGVCSHCRVSAKGDRVKGLWETLAAFLKGLIFKDREAVKCDALPPSVISD